jgi:hypothetical protein
MITRQANLLRERASRNVTDYGTGGLAARVMSTLARRDLCMLKERL